MEDISVADDHIINKLSEYSDVSIAAKCGPLYEVTSMDMMERGFQDHCRRKRMMEESGNFGAISLSLHPSLSLSIFSLYLFLCQFFVCFVFFPSLAESDYGGEHGALD